MPTGVSGQFERGSTVCVVEPSGNEIARGLTNYNFSDCQKLARQQSKDIEPILGYYYGDEIIHRNNLVLARKALRRVGTFARLTRHEEQA